MPELFEGVVTGAADGYARMKDKPASTLLHLGPGLENGLVNLHNARKAQTPIVNIVGDHATYHVEHDAPPHRRRGGYRLAGVGIGAYLQGRSQRRRGRRRSGGAAAWARPGQVGTLILPANTAWEESDGPAAMAPVPEAPRVTAERVKSVATVLRSGKPTVIRMTGHALRAHGLEVGGAIGLDLPMATGAAACPDRKVIGLQVDGSAMYTVQVLGTQAREGLDVTTVLFANRAYSVV